MGNLKGTSFFFYYFFCHPPFGIMVAYLKVNAILMFYKKGSSLPSVCFLFGIAVRIIVN